MRVVLAEDHILVREGIRRSLSDAADIEVVAEAGNGREAVDLVRAHRPDVVVMDIAMPQLNGIEATLQIKHIAPSTAVLILTAYDEDEYILSLLEAGAAGYLLKTASSAELIHALRAVHAGGSVLDAAVAKKFLALLATSGHRTGGSGATLSERECDVLSLAAKGCTNKVIGRQLSLSPRTVQDHLERIFGKLRVGSRTEAVAKGLMMGLIHPEEAE